MRHMVRFLLTAALLVAVYFETGVWTTVALALVALRVEVAAYWAVSDD